MKQLKMFLMLLLTSFLFIPKTFALSEFETREFSGSLYSTNSPYNFIRSYKNVGSVTAGANEFLDFSQVYLKTNYSRSCDGQSFIYRIDYQLYGGHNGSKTGKDWVKFAKLITASDLSGVPNTVEVLGSIVNVPSWDAVNVSTFIKYTWAPSDSCQTMFLNLTLDFNDTYKDLYFYFPNAQSNYYSIYNYTYELTNEQQALQLINEYYEKYSITNEKLDSIDQQLIDANNKLDQTNNKLDQTNDKLDSILDNSSPDLGGLSNASTWLPQGPVDSIIMLPLNFINTIIDKLSGTCSPVNLPIPFMQNKYIVLPCLNTIFEQIDGFSTLFNLVGVIGSVYLLYNYFVRFYKWVDDTLSFRENTWQDWGGD